MQWNKYYKSPWTVKRMTAYSLNAPLSITSSTIKQQKYVPEENKYRPHFSIFPFCLPNCQSYHSKLAKREKKTNIWIMISATLCTKLGLFKNQFQVGSSYFGGLHLTEMRSFSFLLPYSRGTVKIARKNNNSKKKEGRE